MATGVRFLRSNQMSDTSFLDLVKRMFGKTFTKGIDAKNWLITNGYYTSYPDIVTDGLVLYLDAANLDSTTGGDLSGNGNNFNLSGATFSNNLINFDGINNYLESQNVIEFDRTDTFSLCGWVNSNTVNNQQIINNENSSYRGYSLLIHSTNKATFAHRSSTTNEINVKSVASLLSNTWYYLCSTYNGNSLASGVNIYINGIKQSVTTSSNSLTTTTISGRNTRIGSRLPATNGWFNGEIGIIKIYNKELTEAEVAQNYNATKERFGL